MLSPHNVWSSTSHTKSPWIRLLCWLVAIFDYQAVHTVALTAASTSPMAQLRAGVDNDATKSATGTHDAAEVFFSATAWAMNSI